eukprot:scaffold192438_cov15-Tisochrysis_lutea.AAC.1
MSKLTLNTGAKEHKRVRMSLQLKQAHSSPVNLTSLTKGCIELPSQASWSMQADLPITSSSNHCTIFSFGLKLLFVLIIEIIALLSAGPPHRFPDLRFVLLKVEPLQHRASLLYGHHRPAP